MKSRKLLFIVLMALAVTTISNAQKWGVRAGWNSTTFTGSDAPKDISARSGLYVGVYKELPLVKDLLFINPEIQYSNQGAKSSIAGSSKTYTIDYINVPVMAKIYLIKIISIEAGPQFGFKINDNFDSPKPESFDFGVGGGVGVNLPLGLSVNLRYISGLNKVIKDSNVKNAVFQVGAAFQF